MLRRGVLKGSGGGFMMELPKYQWPPLKDVAIGLLTRAQIFLKRAGTIILGTTIVLWALASIPQAGPGQKQSEVSIAGQIAQRHRDRGAADRLQPRHRLALLPAMAAREVAVSAIATVYSIDSPDEQAGATRLEDKLQHRWTPADRARLPRLVRVRAAVHLDDRRHPARDQRLEMAALHGQLSVRAGLSPRA